MLDTFRRAFQIKDIRKKILYTLMMLVVIRLGSQLPTPGVNAEFILEFLCFRIPGKRLTFLTLFTGGSFEQMSVFALSITPYINVFDHYAASDDRNPEAGRDAQRR